MSIKERARVLSALLGKSLNAAMLHRYYKERNVTFKLVDLHNIAKTTRSAEILAAQ